MQAEPTKVLLVEDNEHMREALAEMLREHGYSVTVAGSAEEGLEMLRASRFSLVLTDHGLPAHTGAWMLQEARAAGRLTETGVLVITGNKTPEGTESWKVLHKPVRPDDLLREVAQALAGERS